MSKVENQNIRKIKRIVMWAAMALIMLLFFFSIFGAFIGSQRAKEFFNSIPLVIYWISFIILLVVGIALFKRLARIPTLLFIHVGCIFVLIGGLWGSRAGHELRTKLLGTNKFLIGIMDINEGYADNYVLLEDGSVQELPFYVGLKDFRIEYYQPGDLHIQTRQGGYQKLPAEIGKEYSLGSDLGTVRIVKIFENFKMSMDGESRIYIDDPESGFNPALEVQVTLSDGSTLTRYLFDPSIGYIYNDGDFAMAYSRDISEYISELQIIKDGKVVNEKDIQVNHPLHYGGYHFYQKDYDHDEGKFTRLGVVSDSGLTFVYAGYGMLCIGLFWNFWLIKLRSKGV